MKKFLFIILTLATFSVQGSYIQEYCNNGEGTVRMASGHSQNFLFVTKRTWKESRYTDTVVNMDIFDVVLDYSNEFTLESTSTSSCQEGDKWGVGSWKIVTAKRIIITKDDGSEFSENILGVSSDKKSVGAFWICEKYGSSFRICPQNL